MEFEVVGSRLSIDLSEEDMQFELQQMAIRTRNEVRNVIRNGPKTGRLYRRPDGRFHQASAAGEAPASRTGRLIGSIAMDIGRLEARVGPTVQYGAYLNDGTRDGRIEPRPFLKLGVDRALEINQGFEKQMVDVKQRR